MAYGPKSFVNLKRLKITMKTHLALLRGINVSGQKLIKMEDLRKLLETAGFKNVSTYIQSGNVFVDTDETSKAKVADTIKELIKEKYGWDVGILMLDLPYLKKMVANNPFLKEKDLNLKQLYVTFLSDKPLNENIEKFRQFDVQNDIAILEGDVMYLKYAIGAGQTKLSNALIENKLKVVATSRNWNTTLKLLDLFAARS
jgi:uncharacterized protein (DUF1697 family)